MPSIYQEAGAKTYEPSTLKDRFGEDPARFICCGKHLAIARVRGVRDDDFPDGVTAEEYLRAAKAIARREDAPRSVVKAIDGRLSEMGNQ